MHCFVPFGTATNIVDHGAIKFFTSTEVAVNCALKDLGHFDLSYGTMMNEAISKFSFAWIGKYLGPVLDLAMHGAST